MADRTPLTLETVIERLDVWLDVEFSCLQTEQPAQIIARLARDEQEYILTWVQRVASINIQLAHKFITHVVDALERMDRKIIEAWALHAMEIYDQYGLQRALEVVRSVEEFVRLAHERTTGAVFEEQAGILLHFTHGLPGRQLRLQEDEILYTDTETIYLPHLIARLASPEENFLIYKCMVAYHWAQTRYGTFREPLGPYLDECRSPIHFLNLFQAFESIRLESCLERELPGLYRNMQRLREEMDETIDEQWLTLCQDLLHPDARVNDSIELTRQNLDRIDSPPRSFFHGELYPDRVQKVMAKRMEREKSHFRHILRDLVEEKPGAEHSEPSEYMLADQIHYATEQITQDARELTLNGQILPLPEQARVLAISIMQDMSHIPDEYLLPAGAGEYDPALLNDQARTPDDGWKGACHEVDTYQYKEWDFRRQHYRKNWCTAREINITPVYDDFYYQTLSRYHGLIRQLRKTFEAMRDEDKLLRRQVYGDEVDIDALVEAFSDSYDGSEMSDRLFTRKQRAERNIAVVFMVDMSGSTRGWINEAERESLILLAEALETLGDRYAIYGFSGMARKRCEIYRIKEFDEPYSKEVRGRISGIQPRDYTRMGVAIRHLSHILNQVEARSRILITLSDGQPDDYDNYRGEYGIEDTRRALLEARRDGIHPYCITIDKEAKDYLPHLYGPASYTVIDGARQLPYKLSDIYRRLTT